MWVRARSSVWWARAARARACSWAPSWACCRPAARSAAASPLVAWRLVGAPPRTLRDIRGRRIAVVLQAARAALTPTLRAETWIDRALALHEISRPERAARVAHALGAVRLDAALLRRYPYQLSGGEAQRVSIALAVALRAELILADEATSALDVTVQAEVAELFRELRVSEGTAFLVVSHDLALVAGLADRINIIADGHIVERGGPEVLRQPAHAVTQALVAAYPILPAIEGVA